VTNARKDNLPASVSCVEPELPVGMGGSGGVLGMFRGISTSDIRTRFVVVVLAGEDGGTKSFVVEPVKIYHKQISKYVFMNLTFKNIKALAHIVLRRRFLNI